MTDILFALMGNWTAWSGIPLSGAADCLSPRMWNIPYMLQVENFVLLLEKSAGTKYENYGHAFAFRMTEAYMYYYQEAKRRGLAHADISKSEMHVLCTSFWTAIYEPFIHKMTWKEIEKHCSLMCSFFDWTKLLDMK